MKDHKISLLTAVLLTMNIMIGSGILIGPGNIAAVAGNASFLAWPLVALLFLPLVLCTATLSGMFPNGGGFYTYAREGLNTTAGFMGGLLYIIGYTFALGVEVLALRNVLIAVIGEHWFLSQVMLFNIICISIFVLLNMMSFRLFSAMLNSLTVTKILPIVILIVLIPFVLNWNFSIPTSELAVLPHALPFAIFGFFGFEYCSSLSHLIEDSERNAPRAAVLGFLATAGLYTLFHFGVLNVMGSEKLAQLGASSFAQYLALPIPFLKPLLMFLIPLASALTIFAAGNGMLNSNVIVMQSIAKERVFWGWPFITKLNRYERPWFALLLQGIVIFILVTLIPAIAIIGNLCNLGITSAFLLPFLSLLCIQYRRGLYRGMPLTVLAIVAAFGLSAYSWYQMGSTVGERMVNSIPLIVLLVLGYVLYSLRNREIQEEVFYH